MKIENKTAWDTEKIRKLVKLAFREEGISDVGYNVIVKSGKRKSGIGGRGSYYRKWIKLFIPVSRTVRQGFAGNDGKTFFKDVELFKSHQLEKELVQVARHEIQHTCGVHHEDMVYSSELTVPKEYLDIKLTRAITKEKPKRNIVNERYEHAKKKLLEWQRKETRAMKLKKKWAKKVGYYEKKGS